MKYWLDALVGALSEGRVVVRVVVMQALGSTPREQGAVMLVESDNIVGTIGGGELEWRAIARAREMLGALRGSAALERWPLGPELGQCCGGSVRLWFERLGSHDVELFRSLLNRRVDGSGGFLLTRPERVGEEVIGVTRWWSQQAHSMPQAPAASEPVVLVEAIPAGDPVVWIVGAGHVGRALAELLADLPFKVTVVDGRADQLAMLSGNSKSDVTLLHELNPQRCIERAPAGAVLLIMTHSHELDYQLCKAALARCDLGWVGLIGSETKGICFRLRLSREGVADSAISALVSPIGIDGIRSKLPKAIALSVAAQLMRQFTWVRS